MADVANDDVGQAQATVLLPITEAAGRLGMHPSALRSRVRRGSVAAKRGNSGQLLIEVPTDAGPAPGLRHATPPSPSDELEAEIDVLRRDLGEAAAKVARAEADRDIATATAAAKVEAAERIIAQLTAMLEDARRPFWRRWLGRP